MTRLTFLGVGTRGHAWHPDRAVPINVGGLTDSAPGVYGINPPDLCQDDCPLTGTEHTEDRCSDLAARTCTDCGVEADHPHPGGLCRDCDWRRDNPHATRRRTA